MWVSGVWVTSILVYYPCNLFTVFARVLRGVCYLLWTDTDALLAFDPHAKTRSHQICLYANVLTFANLQILITSLHISTLKDK